MAVTYEPLATTTLTATSTTITFSSISGSYTDLKLIFTGTTSPNTSAYLRFNGDTGNNYSRLEMSGNGATASAGRGTNQSVISIIYTALDTSKPTLVTVDAFSYTSSNFKTVLTTASQDMNGSGSVGGNVGLWRSTAAITSISVLVTSDSFGVGTTATLYGILKA